MQFTYVRYVRRAGIQTQTIPRTAFEKKSASSIVYIRQQTDHCTDRQTARREIGRHSLCIVGEDEWREPSFDFDIN